MRPEQLRAVVGLAPAGAVFRVEGTSMRPFLRPLDEVSVEPLRAGRVRLLDLVVFAHEGGLAAHRVVGLRGDCAILKGDGTRGAGRLVPLRHVLGRVASRRRLGRELRAGSLRWRAEELWSVACSLLRWLRR